MKTSIIWLIVVLTLLGSIFGVYKLAKEPSAGPAGAIPDVTEADQTRGPQDAKVILVEYSDFQCPACGAFFPVVEDLNKELDGKILFVYRHFPLPQHQNAELAAYAAEAAGKQGKFWGMHDALFANQNGWSEADSAKTKEYITKYAESVGLNMSRFNDDLDSSDIKDKILTDQRGGLHAKINATPTFYLNGKKVDGFKTYDEFKNLVREAVRANP